MLSRLDQTKPLYEHERVPFPSYPYEWPAEMLHAAGLLTLDLALKALDEGYGLKDATPYNVLFRGSAAGFRGRTFLRAARSARRELDGLRAVRADVPAASAGQPRLRMAAPADVVRHAATGWSRKRSTARRDSCSAWLRPTFKWSRCPRGWRPNGAKMPRCIIPSRPVPQSKPRYILRNLLNGCTKQLNAAAPRAGGDSTWSEYLDHKSLYSPQQLAEKETFVQEALDLARPATVLDAGANEGHFSLLAARTGAAVVAIDTDPVVVGSIWRRACAENLDVQPLVVDLTRPTPASGWRNQECTSFLDRADGAFRHGLHARADAPHRGDRADSAGRSAGTGGGNLSRIPFD